MATAPDPKSRAHHAASTLGQYLAEIIIQHAPHTSEVAEATKERFRASFLDGLEEHTAKLVGPLLDSVAEVSTIPDELTGLLAELGMPTEQFTGIISQFFVYGLLFQLAGAMLGPFTQQVQNDVWSAHPDRPMPPADLATAAVRGIALGDSAGVTVPDWVLTEGAKSGLDADVMSTLIGTAGLAPALQLLFEMIRRGIISEDQLTQGIKEGDVKDSWIPYVSKLRYTQPSPIDLINAYLRAQIPEDEARTWAERIGLEPAGYLDDNPDWFQILYDTSGRPPGVIELLDLAKRGFIPYEGTGPEVLSIQQAVAESDLKPKWYPAIVDLATYYPPNGEIRTLLEHGWIDEADARALWKANGVPDSLQTAYVNMAQSEQIVQDKALAKGDIETLIQERIITDDEAGALLMRIGYSGKNAAYIVEMAHTRFELDALRSAVRQVEQLYTKRKISATEAKTALDALGLPPENTTSLLDVMTTTANAQVLTPTAGQLTGAAYYGIIDNATAIAGLEQLGYGPWDAWLVLSARLHTAAGPEPPRPATFG